MTIKAAVDEIDSWSITGITNKGIQGAELAVLAADMPALLLLPGTSPYQTDFPPFADSAGILTLVMRHMLIQSGAGLGLSGEQLYALVTTLDTYLAHVRDNVDLGGELVEAMQFQLVRWPVVELHRQYYVGCEVQMLWRIALA